MIVLVATTELQGTRPDDYAHTVDGELVIAEVAECDTPDQCGCGRGFPGLASSRATTTARVAELPHITEDDLRDAISDWLERAGWGDLFRSAATADESFLAEDGFDCVDDMLRAVEDEHLETLAIICAAFPVGTVIERSGSQIAARSAPLAA